MITHALIAKGMPAPVAETQAIGIIQRQVMGQAAMLSYERIFLMFGMGMVLSLPLLLFMRKGKGGSGSAAAH